MTVTTRTAVLGAGPGGLTAGLMLARAGRPLTVLEADEQVGGLAKTVERDGYRFDLGGHRFYTRSDEIEALWHDVLGEEMLLRPRRSRIRWNGRFLDYPLRGADVVRQLGPVELTRAGASYARAALRRRGGEETFEDWVSRRFGRRLFELFFRTYTEKVWGVPTSEIRAEWAAQRIRGLSFLRAVRSALPGAGPGGVKSLIEEFHYPRLGPGQLWEAMADEVERLGGEVRTAAPVTRIEAPDGRVVAVHAGGERIAVDAAISSLPLRALAGLVEPGPPPGVLEAAAGLRYRDFVTVALVLDGPDPFPDTWIYVHEPQARVARIQNFRAWSPWLVPDDTAACVGLEYFCFAGEPLWEAPDAELVELAARELEQLGLAGAGRVRAGHVVRVPKAYPIYDREYAQRVAILRTWIEGVDGLQTIGRNGLHRYNNSDHSMLTAMRAVENLLHGTSHDVWAVNADEVYLEERPAQQPYLDAPRTPAMEHALAEEPAR
jgi:protoporphyrinogen oxidase